MQTSIYNSLLLAVIYMESAQEHKEPNFAFWLHRCNFPDIKESASRANESRI